MPFSEFSIFSNRLDELAELLLPHSRKLTNSVIEWYWKALQVYSLEAVIRAIDQHVADPDQGKFMPKPADLIAHLGKSTTSLTFCAYVSGHGRACRNAGTMSESTSGGGPYYCRAHFPATSDPRFWEHAVTASYSKAPPPPNWRDAAVDAAIEAAGLARRPEESASQYQARMRMEWRAIKPALEAMAQRRYWVTVEENPPPTLSEEEEEQLLAEARARYPAPDALTEGEPPIAQEAAA